LRQVIALNCIQVLSAVVAAAAAVAVFVAFVNKKPSCCCDSRPYCLPHTGTVYWQTIDTSYSKSVWRDK